MDECQKTFSISGYITDEKTGESLIGATVIIEELPGKGTVTTIIPNYPGGYSW